MSEEFEVATHVLECSAQEFPVFPSILDIQDCLVKTKQSKGQNTQTHNAGHAGQGATSNNNVVLS